MSLCRLSCEGVGVLEIKVLKFSTPLAGNITSAQTKEMLQHFPIKSSQQSLTMTVITNGWPEMKALQDFVRGHQLGAMSGSSVRPEITIWWPQRGMNNWSGFITKMPAGDKRFNIAPRADIEFFLVDSLLSEKTFSASIASDFRTLFNSDIGNPASPLDGITPPVITSPGGNNANTTPGSSLDEAQNGAPTTIPRTGGGGTF